MPTRRTVSHVALMRGINVGGKNRLPMPDLVSIFERAGCRNVQTYIQSGNIVFAAPPSVARNIAALVEKEVAASVGFQAPVITRSAAEFAAVVEGVPFSGEAADEQSLHVAFLAKRPTRPAAGALDPSRSPGDAFQLVGREIYLSLPKGIARTKLTNGYLDRTLDTVSTIRNWRTVLKIANMLDLG